MSTFTSLLQDWRGFLLPVACRLSVPDSRVAGDRVSTRFARGWQALHIVSNQSQAPPSKKQILLHIAERGPSHPNWETATDRRFIPELPRKRRG